MYQQSDWQENRGQLKRRLLALFIPMALFLAGVIVSFVLRIQWLTVLLTVLGGGLAIFCYGLFVSPVVCYGRHLRNMLEGRKRETTGVLTAFEQEPCWREGVAYHAMTVNVGEKGEQEDDRLFYYDAHKEKPAFALGDRVTVVSHDKAAAEVRKAG